MKMYGLVAALVVGGGITLLHDLPGKRQIEKTSVEQQKNNYMPTTIDQYVVNAIIQIESHGNPKARRYEPHINDTSYGSMQILTQTARVLEKKHEDLPRLGTTPEEIKQSLLQPEINRAYGERLLQDNFAFYGNVSLAVAAYNSGRLAPKNARIQQQLNDLLGTALQLDGDLGRESRRAIVQFQEIYNEENPENLLAVDGKLSDVTYQALQQVWQKNFPTKENPKGIVPQNNRTPYHMQKFMQTLEEIVLSKGS
ncbi:DUF1615 family protein [Candidatus Woesearchaeota archaeon]|nr:DUF1615 family protein [Candidatus Woesearchaeota archaeon]